ncbi:DUF305 domain-containing protein [Streptomyces sp. NPDC017943]|uniref:DUF305 domain-containing protein n=1 Tax=Streptomyces sp. NPDC017943 TaxID=3365019 RepID=UPI0037998C18
MAPPTPRRFGKALVATVLCAVAVSGCGGPPQPERPQPRAVARPDATEVGWIQLAIAMDVQARHLLLLAPERSGDREVQHWASEVAAGRDTELTRLRALLSRRGVPDDNPHEGHDMPGMADARELRALRTARGRPFDRLLRSALREHLEQARRLAVAVQKADVGADVRRTALDAAASASDALRRMPPP